MKIRLVNVGRGHDTTTFEVPGIPDPEIVAELIVEHASQFLMSRNVSATWDYDKGRGTIYAGFHTVGHAERVD